MYYKTRAEFTQHDREFIAHTLGKTPLEHDAIMQLTNEPESVTQLLHRKKLFEQSMTIPPVFLSISPQLFFYVFIYQALDRKHIADDDVVDYVAGVCVEFRSHKALWNFSSPGEKFVYAVDLLQLLGDVDKHQQYFLRRHIGNVSLFLTGFFPDMIFQRNKNQGAPSLQYYEQIGRSQYETAAEESHTYEAEAAPVLNVLAERFVAIRSALNLFTDAHLNLSRQKRTLDRIERQAQTLDEQSFRESLDL
ncbi:MAG: hypothetical protein HY033_02550 [Ignavibacteriae bacterium]|nr:hypothetical protein [Ignavibacteria bacterium]MBI3363767.1 hypothetical protein [Ignavibacteriota bacterium]